MERKEIIVLMVCLGVGGAERVLTELTNEWVELGHKVTILLREPLSYIHDYEVDERITVISFNNKGKTKLVKRINYALNLRRYLHKHRQATVIAFLNPTIRILGMIMPFVENRLVFSERCDPYHSPKNRYLRIVRNELFKKADICVFQTHGAKEYFSKYVQNKSVVIPNPINPCLLEPYKGSRDKRIVAACQLIPQKNLPMLITAFSMLHKDHPDYKLYIYGRGPLREELIDLSNKLGVSEHVCFPGFVKNINEIMNKAAMYVSSSNYEGISNSMLEALGLGVPTICTDCPIGGAREMIEDGVNGILVPVGDHKALYQAMKTIIEDSELSNKLSAEAIKIRNKYPARIIAEEWLKII